ELWVPLAHPGSGGERRVYSALAKRAPMKRSVERFDRRRFLCASGVCLALPALAALSPRARGAEAKPKRRFVAINLGLGFLPSNFTPAQAGRNYEPTKYLQLIQEFREQFTVISG